MYSVLSAFTLRSMPPAPDYATEIRFGLVYLLMALYPLHSLCGESSNSCSFSFFLFFFFFFIRMKLFSFIRSTLSRLIMNRYGAKISPCRISATMSWKSLHPLSKLSVVACKKKKKKN